MPEGAEQSEETEQVEVAQTLRAGRVVRTLRRVKAHGIYLTSAVLGDDIVGRSARVALLRAAGADLGAGVALGGGTFINHPGRLVIGAGSYIGRGCYLDLESSLVLGNNVAVGHGTSFITTQHRLGPSELRCGAFDSRPITVGEGAWIGANVTILPGVRIGRGAVVAAGAVVSAHVPPNALVAGVPSRILRILSPDPR